MEVLKKLSLIKEPTPGSELALFLQEINRDPEVNQPIDQEVKKIALQVSYFLKSKAASQEWKSKLIAFNEKYQDFQTSRMTPEAFALFLKELTEGVKAIRISDPLAHLIKNQKRLKDF